MKLKLASVSAKLKRGDGRALGALFGQGSPNSKKSVNPNDNFHALQNLAKEATKENHIADLNHTSETDSNKEDGTSDVEDKELNSLKEQALSLNLDGLTLPPEPVAKKEAPIEASSKGFVPPSLNILFSPGRGDQTPVEPALLSPDRDRIAGARRPSKGQGLLANLSPDMRIKLTSGPSGGAASMNSPKDRMKSPLTRQSGTANFQSFLQQIINDQSLSEDDVGDAELKEGDDNDDKEENSEADSVQSEKEGSERAETPKSEPELNAS
jgi:hypothetical protein